ncbi:uncharacterized protein J8A68_000979 [[Candida] subhashii]|uniref:Transcriptional coactivator p15 (PC4) C-terminal domain-containing protein n=1 Tax=[Candida] subhashii TaxID=561895 RepID=A0A8J5QM44_9ASCO|nr:uncharacterized protein J8A68_000979 [[Candida] subhashii]KAG7665577.1 hypothetical protein J8A68_000979 [[Candida] subhashii]
MAYKRSYSNRGSYNNPAPSSSSSSSDDVVIELDKKKQVTIRKFNNINLIDIREFYVDKDGEKKPGKKGISLTEDTWFKLLDSTNKIQNALDLLNGHLPKDVRPSVPAPVTKKAKIEKKKVEDSDDEEFEDVDISQPPKQQQTARKAPAAPPTTATDVLEKQEEQEEEESDADE